LMIATIMAGLTKGNGLVILLALFGVWVIRLAVRGRGRGKGFLSSEFLFLFIWLAAYVLIVPFFGQYIERYEENGSPFYNTMTPDPLPSLFARSENGRPGVVSFSESYLTFPFLNLVETPYILSNGHEIIPLHRTSLWAQLYGGANFAHFDQWPESWQTYNPIVENVGRCIMVLAILPTLAGMFYFIFYLSRNVPRLLFHAKYEEEPWIHTLVLLGYILFIMLYSWEIRDFSTMKPIYIFPALISIVFFMANGLDAIVSWIKKDWIRSIMQCALGGLVFFYIVDIGFLILQLAHHIQWL
jgi:hypothetical protein